VADWYITTDGEDSDVESLHDWLRNEPELRGHLRHGEPEVPPGSIGGSAELIVGIVSTRAATALATSLHVWLGQQPSDLTLNITGPLGRQVVIDARGLPDAARLLDAALGLSGDQPGD
jgi:hypothetical protein